MSEKLKYVEALIEDSRYGPALVPLGNESFAAHFWRRPVWPPGELVAVVKLSDLERLIANQKPSAGSSDLATTSRTDGPHAGAVRSNPPERAALPSSSEPAGLAADGVPETHGANAIGGLDTLPHGTAGTSRSTLISGLGACGSRAWRLLRACQSLFVRVGRRFAHQAASGLFLALHRNVEYTEGCPRCAGIHTSGPHANGCAGYLAEAGS